MWKIKHHRKCSRGLLRMSGCSVLFSLLLVSSFLTLPLLAASQSRNASTYSVDYGPDWVHPENITGAPDVTCALTSDCGGVTPCNSWIQVTFPAFSIPASDAINGILVRVKYRSSSDNLVQLTNGGSLIGSPRTLAEMFIGPSACSSTQFVEVGGSTDTWGLGLTAADFNAGNIGLRVTQNNGPTLDIDAVELVVFYGNEPPVAECTNVTVPANSSCQAAASIDDGSYDADGDPITVTQSPPGPYGLGATLVTLTVTDDSSASDTCQATVTVEDETPPVISLAGANPLLLECGVDSFSDPGATASDNCDTSVSVTQAGTVDVSTPGNYTRTYDASDAAGNNAIQVSRTVTVQDTIAPVITLLGNNPLTLECGVDSYVEPGASVTDACDQSVTAVIDSTAVDAGEHGGYGVTYNATDASGNTAVEVTRTVNVQDTIAPVITLLGDNPLTLECGVDSYVEPGATVADACDESVTVDIDSSAMDPGMVGSYPVTYDAVDASSNAAVQQVRSVNVEDTLPPEISCNSPDTITPPDAPISFAASAVDVCVGAVAASVGGYDCFWQNPGGKLVDKTRSCIVSYEGDSVTIDDSGGIDDTIQWTVGADDGNGNPTEMSCSVVVASPSRGKASHTLAFPQFGSGAGLVSELVLQNPAGDRSVEGSVRFVDSEGQPLEVELAESEDESTFVSSSRVDFRIAPLGSVTILAGGGGAIQAGSAIVESHGQVGGLIRFTVPELGTTTLGPGEVLESAMLSVRRVGAIDTGAAILNPEDRSVTISLTLLDRDGMEVPRGSATYELPPGGRLALFVEELFPEAETRDFTGELLIRAREGTFVAIALEMGNQPGQFSAVPVTPVREQ